MKPKITQIVFLILFTIPVYGVSVKNIINDSIEDIRLQQIQDTILLEELKDSAFNCYLNNDFEKALEYQFKHLDLARELNDSFSIAKSLHRIASEYCGWDKYRIGIQYYYKAYALYKDLGDTLWMAHEMNDIGYAYLYYEDYEKVIEFYQKALAIYKRMHIKKEIALAEANIGFAYSFWGKQEEAIQHHSSALEIYKELKDSASLAKMYHGLGDAERRRGNYREALEYLKKAYQYSLRFQDEAIQNEHRLRIAQVYSELGNFKLAEQAFRECLPGLKKRNSGKWLKNFYEALYEFNMKRKNIPEAFKAYKKFKMYEDSLFNARLQSEIVEMQIIHETKEKEQRIVLLQTQNKLAQTEIKHQRRVLIISISTLLVFAILLVFIYRQYLSRNRAYKKLFEKNKELIDYETKYNNILRAKEKETVEPNSSTSLKEDERERIIRKLEHLIEDKKIYLNNDLNLNQLCKKLQTNSTYLSQIINQKYGKNVNSFLNEYRVKEVQKCLINGEHKTLTIEAIASKSGFKTRATFNTAFKKITGLTPSYYINSLNKEN